MDEQVICSPYYDDGQGLVDRTGGQFKQQQF